MRRWIKKIIKPQPRRSPSKINRWIVSLYTKHLYGPEKIDCKSNELIVLCLVRNGEEYIKAFVQHYTKLGAKHIVFLDNNSKDKTVSHACRYKNVTVLQTKLPYRTYAWVFKPYLLNRFAKKCWCLCVDIDEFFDYPFSDVISLDLFLSYLNKKSYNAVVTQTLDMFSDKPLSKIEKSNKFSRRFYRFYDVSSIRKSNLPGDKFISNKNIKFHKGGIHSKVFGLNDIYLTKYPLIFLKEILSADDFRTHFITKNAKLADFSCVLFHYKFTSDLYQKCKTAIIEKNYVEDSYEYKKYFKMLKKHLNINIYKRAKNPVKFKSIDDLIKAKFLYISKDYIKWIKS